MSSHLTAQPNPPKIHEGWWAYKEVVQGSFVPGKPQHSMQHFDGWKFPTEYRLYCIHFKHSVLDLEVRAYYIFKIALGHLAAGNSFIFSF